MSRVTLIAAALLPALFASAAAAQQSAANVWETLLRPHHFPGTEIVEDTTVIDMSAPYRSEDAAVTPIRIEAKIPQTPERYIKTIHLFVDANPEPKVGTFEF
ncbi:MAG: thiosulfate oxidation carrier protein SoxY, partial [Gammaproteobacteria bacterium]